MRTLAIHFKNYKGVEVLKNIKTESRAWEILKNRGNVSYAEYGGRVIFGSKPVKTKKSTEMTMEEMEAHIKSLSESI